LAFLQSSCEGGVIQAALIELGPVRAKLGGTLGGSSQFVHEILDTERERITVVEVPSFLESTPPLEPVDSVRGTGDIPDTVVLVILDTASAVLLTQQLQAVITDDYVYFAALPLVNRRGPLHALKSGNQDVFERLLCMVSRASLLGLTLYTGICTVIRKSGSEASRGGGMAL
jgi:hypothetical protein